MTGMTEEYAAREERYVEGLKRQKEELRNALLDLVICPVFTGTLFGRDRESHRAWTMARDVLSRTEGDASENELDEYERKHLREWVESNISEGERDRMFDDMKRVAEMHPDLLAIGWTRVREEVLARRERLVSCLKQGDRILAVGLGGKFEVEWRGSTDHDMKSVVFDRKSGIQFSIPSSWIVSKLL